MLSAIIAAITLLSGIVSLIAWWVKRKRAPTKEERLDDVKRQFTDTLANVARLRAQGDNAEADAMFRRLGISSSVFVRDEPPKTVNPDEPKR